MTWLQLIAVFTASAAAAAAILSFVAARIEVRDNMDEFMNDLRRQGRWAQAAAAANVIAAAAVIMSMATGD